MKGNNTALHFAAIEGNTEIVKLLLETVSEEGQDKLIEFVMKENGHKLTALHFAAYKGHEEIVKLLLKTFSKKSKLIEYVMKENDNKSTALHFAAHKGRDEIVNLLLSPFPDSEAKKNKFRHTLSPFELRRFMNVFKSI